MATKTVTLDLEGYGGHDVTEPLLLTAQAPIEATVEVWAAGDTSYSSEWLDVYLEGTLFANNVYGSTRTSPIPDVREEAEKIYEGTFTFGVIDPNVRVTSSGYVDPIDGNLAARVWVVVKYEAVGHVPDLYRDFAYARITQDVGATDTTIYVDDVSRFPDSALLDKSIFLMTIESDLSQGAFEIVRVVSVDDVNRTIDVLRGMEGTQPHPHPSYVIIKGAVTAGMMQRVRSVYVKDSLPTPDPDVYFDGDVVFEEGYEVAYILVGGEWIAFTAGVARQIAKLAGAVAQVAGDVALIQDTMGDTSTQMALMQVARHLTYAMEQEATVLDQSKILTRMGMELVDNEEAIQQLESDVLTLKSGLDATTAAIALGG